MASKKHKKEHHEEHIDETWLIPYADLLTLLLALFIVLYALVVQDIKKFEEQLLAFSAAFKDGLGILTTKSNAPPIKDIPDIRAREEIKDKNTASEVSDSTKKQRPEDAKKEEKNKQAQAQQQQQMQAEQVQLEKLKQKIDQYIKDNKLKSDLDTKLDKDMLLITIRDNALFGSGQAAIKPEAQKLAAAMATLLSNYADYEMIVAGHTDDQPISTAEFPSNWDLSAKRSLNFMTYMFNTGKLNEERFSSVGYGEFRPIASNETVEGRNKNRRVEIQIMRNFKGNAPDQVLTITP
jgi:chemotaxis protein MotB